MGTLATLSSSLQVLGVVVPGVVVAAAVVVVVAEEEGGGGGGGGGLSRDWVGCGFGVALPSGLMVKKRLETKRENYSGK